MEKRTLKYKVEEVLRNVPETRNSDILLTHKIWEIYHCSKLFSNGTGALSVRLVDMYDLPREDNVKRIRAQFNAQGKYYPTDWKIAEARGLKENEWRTFFGYPEKEETRIPTKVESYMDPVRSFEKEVAQPSLL